MTFLVPESFQSRLGNPPNYPEQILGQGMYPAPGTFDTFPKGKGKRKLESLDLPQGYDYERHRTGAPQDSSFQRGRTRAATRDLISERNAQESPFLRLPAEIRNQIYEHALGNKVIHISVRDCPTRDPDGWSYRGYYYYEERNRKTTIPSTYSLKFTHAICNLPHDDESRLYDLTCQTSAVPAADLEKAYPDRHAKCYAALAALKRNWVRVGDHVYCMPRPNFHLDDVSRLPVALLRTCRQIHKESHHLLYPTNTFAFHEGLTLNLFVKSLPIRQRRMIQTIQADGYLTGGKEVWSIEPTTTDLLTGLKTLQVWFKWGEQFAVCGVNTFSQRRLHDVKVVIGPHPKHQHSEHAALRRRKAELVERDLRGEKLKRDEKNLFEWNRFP